MFFSLLSITVMPTTPTYSPLPPQNPVECLRTYTCRCARYAEPYPVQPLKGLRGSRTDTVFYRAVVPAGHGGCGMSSSFRALAPDGADVSAAHHFPLRSLARHRHSAANAVSGRNLQLKLVCLRGRRHLHTRTVCLRGRRHLHTFTCRYAEIHASPPGAGSWHRICTGAP